MPYIKKEHKGTGEASLSKFILELIQGIDDGSLSIIKQDNVIIQINTSARIQLSESPHFSESSHLSKEGGLDKAV